MNRGFLQFGIVVLLMSGFSIGTLYLLSQKDDQDVPEIDQPVKSQDQIIIDKYQDQDEDEDEGQDENQGTELEEELNVN